VILEKNIVRTAFLFLVLGAGAVLRAGRAPLIPSLPEARAVNGTPVPQRGPYDTKGLIGLVTSRSLFRASRRAASVAYSPAVTTQPAQSIPARPTLRAVGMLDGDRPTAIIEGLPGVEGGRAVRTGDIVGPLHVTRIAGGYVRIEGLDTSWTLRVTQP